MKNFYLLIGEDDKKIEFNLFQILSNINYDENSKIVYDMNNSSFSLVIEEASMNSLFSSVKVIIVNNFVLDNISDYEFECFSKLIESNIKDVYIILIAKKNDARRKKYKLLKDNFEIIELDKLDNLNILNYIKDTVKNNGFSIDSMNIEYLFSKIGSDINNINNELNKLFIYKFDNKVINREDIDLLVFSNIDNVIYEFTNAILDNDYDKIKIMYDKFMLDNVGIDYLISSLAGSLRTNYIIKLLYNKNMSNMDIAKIIGKKEFFVKKSLERLYKYTLDDLGNFINKLCIIDRDIKTGNDKVNSFELFLYCMEE